MVAATSRRRWGGDASSGGLTAADDDSTTAPKVCDEEGSLQLAGSLLPHDAEGREAPRRTGTTWSALFHILTAVIGAGVLALPYAVSMLGWVAGPICILLFGVLTQICSVLLADCYIVNGVINRTYSECVASTFPGWPVTTIGIIQHVNLVLVTWAYAITAPQSLQTIARSICSETGATSCFTNYNWWAIIFGASQLLMVQLPDIDSLKYSSLVGGLMAFGYSGIATGLSIAEAGGDPHGTVGGASFADPSDKAFQVLNAIGAILFAFNFSIQLIEIQDTIRPDAKPGPVAGMRKAVSISVVIMTGVYLAVACSGYAAFGDAVPGSIMTAFSGPSWLVTTANLMVVIHLGPAYQICLQPTLMFVEGKLQRWRSNPHWNRGVLLRLWFRSLAVVLITFCACLMPWFGTVIGLSGALSFWPATVIYPVEMWLRVRGPTARQRFWLRALSAATLVVTLGAVVGAVQQLVDAWSTFELFSGS